MSTAAAAVVSQNAAAGLSSPQIEPASALVPGDSVRLTVSGAWSTVFARVLGLTSLGVSASATAMTQSALGCSVHGCDVLRGGCRTAPSRTGGPTARAR